MFLFVEAIAIVYAIALCLFPAYLLSAISIAGFKIKTLLNIMMGVAIVYRAMAITTNNFRISRFAMVIYGLMFVGWAGIIISALASTSQTDFSLRSLTEGEVLPNLLTLTVFVMCGSQPGFVQRYCRALMLAGLVVAAVEVFEVLHRQNPFSHFAASTVVSVNDTSRNGAYRAFSTFAHPLVLAEFLSFAITAALFVSLDSRRLGKLVALLALPLFCIGEYFTNTRSSLLLIGLAGVLFASGVWLTALVRRVGMSRLWFVAVVYSPIWIMLIWFVIPAAADFASTYFAGKTGDEVASTLSRNRMHAQGIQYILEQPLGYGYGNAIQLVAQNSLGNLSLDDYFLFVALNSGFFSALALLLVALLTSAFGISRAMSSTAPPYVGAFIFTLPLLWVVCSFTQTIWDIHYLFYSVVGIAISFADRALITVAADDRPDAGGMIPPSPIQLVRPVPGVRTWAQRKGENP